MCSVLRLNKCDASDVEFQLESPNSGSGKNLVGRAGKICTQWYNPPLESCQKPVDDNHQMGKDWCSVSIRIVSLTQFVVTEYDQEKSKNQLSFGADVEVSCHKVAL